MICHVTIQVVYELPATSQWMFECHWCPRNPAIISTASFDGHISLYSLLGGGGKEVVPETHKVLWGGGGKEVVPETHKVLWGGGGKEVVPETHKVLWGGGGKEVVPETHKVLWGGEEGRRWCQRHTRYYVLCAHIQRYWGGGGGGGGQPAMAPRKRTMGNKVTDNDVLCNCDSIAIFKYKVIASWAPPPPHTHTQWGTPATLPHTA